MILAAFIGGSLTLYAWRASAMRTNSVFGVVSRESGLVANNVLLVVATLVVFFGTICPLGAEVVSGRKMSVGAPYFNQAFTPFMVTLAVILPPFAILPWKRGNLSRAMQPLWGVLALSVALGALVWAMQTGGSMIAPIGIALAAWLVLGSLTDLALRARAGRSAPAETLRRLKNLPRSDWGKTVAHCGLGVTFFGIAGITAWQSEDIRVVQPGDRIDIAGYELTLDRVDLGDGPNYTFERAILEVTRNGRAVTTLATRKAPVSGAGHANNRSRHRPAAQPRPLCGAGRCTGGRRLGIAHLCQTLRQLDLDRRPYHGGRRCRQPERPQIPRRRAAAPFAARGRRRPGGVAP